MKGYRGAESAWEDAARTRDFCVSARWIGKSPAARIGFYRSEFDSGTFLPIGERSYATHRADDPRGRVGFYDVV